MAVYMTMGGIEKLVANSNQTVGEWSVNQVKIDAIDLGYRPHATKAVTRLIHTQESKLRAVVESTRVHDHKFEIVVTTFKNTIKTSEWSFSVTTEDTAIWTSVEKAIKAVL